MKPTSFIATLLIFSCCISCNDGPADIMKSEPYLEMWQQLFRAQNKMDSSYFAEHISVESEERLNNEIGEYFKVTYKVNFDWFESTQADSFMIFINGVSDTSLIQPKNQYLWYGAIDNLIKADLLGSYITTVGSWDSLAYTDLEEVMKYVWVVFGDCETAFSQMQISSIDFELDGFFTKEKGDPCLFYSCHNSNPDKPCVIGYLNLIQTTLRRDGVECD